jgi:hypothetical protein
MYFLVALAFVITYFLTWQIAFLAYASIKKTKPSESSYSLIGIGCLAVEFVVVSLVINSL